MEDETSLLSAFREGKQRRVPLSVMLDQQVEARQTLWRDTRPETDDPIRDPKRPRFFGAYTIGGSSVPGQLARSM